VLEWAIKNVCCTDASSHIAATIARWVAAAAGGMHYNSFARGFPAPGRARSYVGRAAPVRGKNRFSRPAPDHTRAQLTASNTTPRVNISRRDTQFATNPTRQRRHASRH